MKKLQNTTNNTINKIVPPIIAIIALLGFWQFLSVSDIMPSFMMPSPLKVFRAFISDWNILWEHAATTLREAFLGLFFGILLSFIISVAMDACTPIYNALYPIIVITQTIPSIAIAPLLTLWLGYGDAAKVVLVTITTFFPVTVGLLDGFRSVDSDAVNLLKSMGAGPVKRFIHIKIPYSLGYFFSGLKISAAYAIVGAVISEWLGGTKGLGVFMTRVRKSFAYDRLFSVIIFISAISLILMLFITLLKWLIMPWEREKNASKQKNMSHCSFCHAAYMHNSVQKQYQNKQ